MAATDELLLEVGLVDEVPLEVELEDPLGVEVEEPLGVEVEEPLGIELEEPLGIELEDDLVAEPVADPVVLVPVPDAAVFSWT